MLFNPCSPCCQFITPGSCKIGVDDYNGGSSNWSTLLEDTYKALGYLVCSTNYGISYPINGLNQFNILFTGYMSGFAYGFLPHQSYDLTALNNLKNWLDQGGKRLFVGAKRTYRTGFTASPTTLINNTNDSLAYLGSTMYLDNDALLRMNFDDCYPISGGPIPQCSPGYHCSTSLLQPHYLTDGLTSFTEADFIVWYGGTPSWIEYYGSIPVYGGTELTTFGEDGSTTNPYGFIYEKNINISGSHSTMNIEKLDNGSEIILCGNFTYGFDTVSANTICQLKNDGLQFFLNLITLPIE